MKLNNGSSDRLYKDFISLLNSATKNIDDKYISFIVQGQEESISIYRERVYCYELYHQLRCHWNLNGLILNGEVDKSGHEIMKGNHITNTKPDLLVHYPGNMEKNFIIIEIKSIDANEEGLTNDIKKLLAYLDTGQYKHAIYLFYSKTNYEKEQKLPSLFNRINSICKKHNLNLLKIDLFYHVSGQGIENFHVPID